MGLGSILGPLSQPIRTGWGVAASDIRWRIYMKKCLLVVSVMLFLAGCQNSSTVREATGANDFVSLEGASLVLNQPLSIGPAKARVFVQNGAA